MTSQRVFDGHCLTLILAYLYRVSGHAELVVERASDPETTVMVSVAPHETFQCVLARVLDHLDAGPSTGAWRERVAPSAVHPVSTKHFVFFSSDLSFRISLGAGDLPARCVPHLVNLHDRWAGRVDAPLEKVDFLEDDERHLVLDTLARAAPSAPGNTGRTLHSLFESAVRSDPRKLAVQCGEERMSYAELDERANQLAHHLARRGAGPGARIALLVERNIDTMVAVFGILKAGAAYIPLDPSWPDKRIADTLAEARPVVVVTQESLRARLSLSGVPPVSLDGDRESIRGERTGNPSVATRSGELIYIIYTSGSTGRPKGVLVPHSSVVSYLDAMRWWITPGDTALATASLSFDMHVDELLLPLATGASVLMVTRAVAADGRRLRRVLEESDVSAMIATPTGWQMLVDAGWLGNPRMKANSGGEMLTGGLATALLSRVRSLCNVYGPTETCCAATMHRIEGREDPSVHVGRPLANREIYVLDPAGLPQPVGVPGEIWIGGAGVAQGYLNSPELTAQKFHPDPFSGRAGARLYRTGDLGRWRSDGNLEVRGRADGQVKIRGYRVELGEIEEVLLEHPEVSQSVVIVREDESQPARLVAYVVGLNAEPAAVIEFAKQRLPPHMIPAAVVRLDTLPVTTAGKVDRRSLPAPVQPRPGSAIEGPTDRLETCISEVFREVLHLDAVGRADNFFDLGGTSVLAVRALISIERRLERERSIGSLYEAPTVQTMAELLRATDLSGVMPILVPVRPEGRGPPFFCVHAFIGSLPRDLSRHTSPDQPFYALQPRGLDGRIEPHRSIGEMAAAYVEEVRSVQPAGPYHLGGYCFGGMVALEMARLLRAAGEEVGALIVIDAPMVNRVPGTWKGWMRLAVNFPVVVTWKLLHLLRHTRVQSLLPSLKRSLSLFTARLHARSGRPSAPANVTADVQSLVRGLPGMDSWPKNYQRIAENNYLLLLRHVPQDYDGPITLIRGRHDHPVLWEDSSWGWDEIADRVDVRQVPASHTEIMNEPHVRTVAGLVDAVLKRAAQDLTTPHPPSASRPTPPSRPSPPAPSEPPPAAAATP